MGPGRPRGRHKTHRQRTRHQRRMPRHRTNRTPPRPPPGPDLRGVRHRRLHPASASRTHHGRERPRPPPRHQPVPQVGRTLDIGRQGRLGRTGTPRASVPGRRVPEASPQASAKRRRVFGTLLDGRRPPGRAVVPAGTAARPMAGHVVRAARRVQPAPVGAACRRPRQRAHVRTATAVSQVIGRGRPRVDPGVARFVGHTRIPGAMPDGQGRRCRGPAAPWRKAATSEVHPCPVRTCGQTSSFARRASMVASSSIRPLCR